MAFGSNRTRISMLIFGADKDLSRRGNGETGHQPTQWTRENKSRTRTDYLINVEIP